MPREKVEFEDVDCLKATERAILCNIDGDEKWVPQSVMDDDSEVWQEGDTGKLVVQEWWAVKVGLV